MKVILAKTAGFCMGVRRAMEIVMAETNRREGRLYTFGPLIHNQQVLDLLAAKGVEVTDDPETLEQGRIVIRAHGIPPEQHERLEKTGLRVIDATCPRVTRVQAIIRHHTGKGREAIIVGDRDHAEVIGLMGYSRTEVHVIQGEEDVPGLPQMKNPFVVAQTTQNQRNFSRVVHALQQRFPALLIFDTICDATQERQQEVRTFKGEVDAVVVVGGYHSGNTRRLTQISRAADLPTFHVETEKDLDMDKLSRMRVVGLTAGASTPHWMIKNVMKEIEGISSRREILPVRWSKQVFRFLVLSNLVVALGAFSFACAAQMLAGRRPDLAFPLLTFLYLYAMHIFNRFLDKGASAYNDPDRAAFLERHKVLLNITGISAILLALALSWIMGVSTLIALCALSLLGVIYSIPLVPERFRRRYRFVKIKDIPGSRSLSEALAWVAVITVLPMLETAGGRPLPALISGLVVFLWSYARAILFSLFQVQGDLMVGAETLPITLGERRTLLFLKVVLFISALVLITGPLSGMAGPFSYLMLIPLLTLSLSLGAYEKQWLYPGIPLEALVESNFILAGLLALIWHLL
ncbi:MAG: 4-hydroxy-3-methylbut-2-enyl diphosphate reductase [Deltaproteobacteria bacterium]|nr:4-hydroxy-3-methylbut-2-enyl diphosphate reductase [Deltaproteobacteria bacterium]MBW2112701.1 4-hydroxy-3-methylbut-2-enyl diphosphate reductase [Deltaproteobacteria bacterium]